MGRREKKALAVLVIAVALFPLLPLNIYYVTIMIFVGINSIIALGLCLLMGYAGQISLGHAAFYAFGSYSTAILTTKLGLPPAITFFFALGITSFVALLIAIPSLKLRGHYLAMATLGFGEVVHIAANELHFLTGGPDGVEFIPRLAPFGRVIRSDTAYYYIVWLAVFSALVISLNLVNSRVGRALKAIHFSEEGASASGVDVAGYKIKVFVLSAAFASVAGFLYAHYMTFISPSSYSLAFSVMLVTMVVIGGMKSLWGALLGAFILTSLPEYLRIFEDYDILIYGAVLLFVMVFFPRGIMGHLPNLLGNLFEKTDR